MFCLEIEPRHVTLAELGPDDCRYPFGERDFTFCGNTKLAGSSYCRVHHAACWVKPLKTWRAAA